MPSTYAVEVLIEKIMQTDFYRKPRTSPEKRGCVFGFLITAKLQGGKRASEKEEHHERCKYRIRKIKTAAEKGKKPVEGERKDGYGMGKIIFLAGNYGSGKTELALNLAIGFAKSGRTALVDIDIVNPYFRSAEHGPLLEGHTGEIDCLCVRQYAGGCACDWPRGVFGV